MSRRARTRKISSAALLVLLGFVAGISLSFRAVSGEGESRPDRIFTNAYWAAYRAAYPAPEPPDSVLRDLFWETHETLLSKYIAPGELDEEDLLYGAIRGMVAAAGDPHTSFFTPVEAQQFLEDASGHFDGIGAEIGIRNGLLTVVSPLAGSPASRSGLLSGDIIVAIDGEDTAMMTLEEAVSKIRGLSGTEVRLEIFREGEADTREVRIVRERIDIPTLAVSTPEEGIIHIELYSFSEDAPQLFREQIEQIVTQGTKGLVLDMRNNPGGFLDASIEIAELFLERGEISVIERQRDQADVGYQAEGTGPLRDVPVVVLLNGGSASAAEILAGALRDNRGALLVGETTFGKGTVQEFPPLTGGAALKVTTGEWLTPNEVSLRDGGLEPDIEIVDDPETNADEALERAIEALLEGA